MTDPAWVPEARDIPAELDKGFDRADYPPRPVHFDSIADKLDHATLEQLRELMHGGIGEPQPE